MQLHLSIPGLIGAVGVVVIGTLMARKQLKNKNEAQS